MAILTANPRRRFPAPRFGRCRPRLPPLFCALIVAAMEIAGASVSIAQEPVASECELKAAFLVNFPKYVDWPKEAFTSSNSSIVIGVLGETRVNEEIRKVIAGRSVNGREIVVKRLASSEEAAECHILFIPAAEQLRSPNLVASLKNTRVLTVGESKDFLECGGIINLSRRDQKIALEVNLAAADKASLKISSKLLSVANVVKGKSK